MSKPKPVKVKKCGLPRCEEPGPNLVVVKIAGGREWEIPRCDRHLNRYDTLAVR